MFSQIRRSAGRVPRVRKRKPGLGPFILYHNILKILAFKVSLITNTMLIKVCFFVNLFCVYAYFIFNVY